MIQYYFLGILVCAVGSSALYSTAEVVELTPDNFDSKVTNSDDVWLVEFYAPWCGHCMNLVPEYTKVAKALKGMVKVGAVDADAHKKLGSRFNVKGYPTIKIITGDHVEDYKGQRTVDAMVDAALAASKMKAYSRINKKPPQSDSGSDVVTLTDSNFKSTVLDSDEMWLVEFYAPWCGHCKNLEPHWARAATQLKGKMKLGALDATVNQGMASKYQVQGYPTIKFFPGAGREPEEYNGGRDASDIVAWATDKLAQNVAAPEVKQVIDQATLAECTDKPLCVVAVLPHILDCDAACRNDYLAMLAKLGDKYKQKMWGWIWSEAGAQAPLEEALELGGFGYPAMAVLNAKKLKFSTLRGSFSESGINEFLRDLSFGRGHTAPVRGATLPAAAEHPAWDGQDGTLPPEEDIDLSDVDLDHDEL